MEVHSFYCPPSQLRLPCYPVGTRATRTQTVTLMKVDPQTLATGYRSSKIVGSTVITPTKRWVASMI